MLIPRLGLATVLFVAPSALGLARQEASSTSALSAALLSERVEPLAAELLEVVRAEEDARLETVRVAVSDQARIERALYEESLPLMRVQFEGEESAQSQARAFAASLAPMLLAKYAFDERVVLVNPAAFERVAELLEEPELASEAVLRAVIVHELLHAVAHERYDFPAVLYRLRTSDAIQVYNAVLEGHAQHRTRAICAERGWSAGFERFTAATGATPPVDQESGAAVELLQQLAVATLASWYRDGEAFFAAIVAAGGAEAVRRAFREPPAGFELIEHPEWYLHPERRPPERDLEAVLEGLRARFPAPEWLSRTGRLSGAQLSVALSLLPPEVVARVTAGMRQARHLSATHAAAPGDSLVSVALYEFSSEAEARFFLEANRRLLELKDEEMAEGTIRIVGATYQPIERGAVRGVLARKTVAVDLPGGGHQELGVENACVVRGALAVEVLYSNEPVEPEDVIKLASIALARASRDEPARSPSEPAPETPDEETPDEETARGGG